MCRGTEAETGATASEVESECDERSGDICMLLLQHSTAPRGDGCASTASHLPRPGRQQKDDFTGRATHQLSAARPAATLCAAQRQCGGGEARHRDGDGVSVVTPADVSTASAQRSSFAGPRAFLPPAIDSLLRHGASLRIACLGLGCSHGCRLSRATKAVSCLQPLKTDGTQHLQQRTVGIFISKPLCSIYRRRCRTCRGRR